MGSFFSSRRSEIELETYDKKFDEIKEEISRLNKHMNDAIDSLHKKLENGGLYKPEDTISKQYSEEREKWEERFEKEKLSLKLEFDKEKASLENEIDLKRKELDKYCKEEVRQMSLDFEQNLLESCKQEAMNFCEQLASFKEKSISENEILSALKKKIMIDVSLINTAIRKISAWQSEKSSGFKEIKDLMIELIGTQVGNGKKIYTIEEKVAQKMSSLLETQCIEINAIKTELVCEVNKINNEVSNIKLQIAYINSELKKSKEAPEPHLYWDSRINLDNQIQTSKENYNLCKNGQSKKSTDTCDFNYSLKASIVGEIDEQSSDFSRFLEHSQDKMGTAQQIVENFQSEINFIKNDISSIMDQIEILYKNNKKSQLHKACETGSITRTEELLKQGANVNAIDEDGRSPIFIAAAINNVPLVKLLCDYKTEINCKDRYGLFPIFEGDHEILKCLLNYGANPDITLKNGLSFCHLAVLNNDLKVIKLLLESKLQFDAMFNNKISPIHVATIMGFENVIIEFKHFGIIAETNDNLIDCGTFINTLLDSLKFVNECFIYKAFCILCLVHLCKNIYHRKDLSKSQLVPILSKHLKYECTLNYRSSMDTMIWNIFSQLTESVPEIFQILLDNNIINHSIMIFSNANSDKECLTFTLQTITNIAENKAYRQHFLNSFLISKVLELFGNEKINILLAIKFLCHIICVDIQNWISVNPSRKEVLLNLETVISDLNVKKSSGVKFSSLESIFELISQHDIPEVQLCGVWILDNLVTVDPQIYCPLIKTFDGLKHLFSIVDKSTIQYLTKKFIGEIINIYYQYEN